MVDKIKLILKEPLIVNTDLSSGPCIHWIVLYPVGNVCYIIDPLSKDNYRPYDNIMIDKIKNYDLKFLFYPGRYHLKTVINVLFQHYELYFLKSRNLKNHLIVNELFGLKPDNNDIKQLLKYFRVLKAVVSYKLVTNVVLIDFKCCRLITKDVVWFS